MAEDRGATGAPPPRKGIQSVEIGARLLDALIEGRQPMRLKELSERAALSPSKARMYLVSLIRTGLIQQDEKTGLYEPGPKALRLGMAALGSNRLLGSARHLTVSLGKETGHPVLLIVWDGQSPVIVESTESADALPIAFRVGAQTPLWTTATGSVFLAFLPERVSERLIAEECPARHRREVARAATRARKDGYAWFAKVRLTEHATLGGYGAIAAPLLGREGSLQFVITILAPEMPDGERPDALIRLLRGRIAEFAQAHGNDANGI